MTETPSKTPDVEGLVERLRTSATAFAQARGVRAADTILAEAATLLERQQQDLETAWKALQHTWDQDIPFSERQELVRQALLTSGGSRG